MTESALSIMIMKDGHRMKLYEGNIGATYRVKSVHVDEAINRRLEALGVNENTPLLVMNKKKQRNHDHQSPRNPPCTGKKNYRWN